MNKEHMAVNGSVGLTDIIFDMWPVCSVQDITEEGDTLKWKADEIWTTEPDTEGRRGRAPL